MLVWNLLFKMSAFIRFVIVIIFIAIVLVGFVFSVNNTMEVPLWVGVDLAPQRIGIWVMMAFIVGAMSGLLLGFGLFKRIKYKVQLIQLRSRLKSAEKKLAATSLPVLESDGKK